MEFPGIAGNERIKKRIEGEARKKALPHAAIITGGTGEQRQELAVLLASALVCREAAPPCLRCGQCRKVSANIHPDVVFIRAEGKILPVDRIRELKYDVGIRPCEASHKVYVICDGDSLNDSSANALLKTIEEPPSYAAFILLCENPQLLPETIRSRCAMYGLSPEEEKPDGESEALAESFASALMKKDELKLAAFAMSLEKASRDRLDGFFDAALELLAGAASAAAGARSAGLTEIQIELAGEVGVRSLAALGETMKKLKKYNARNAGSGHMAGLLAAECWEEIN